MKLQLKGGGSASLPPPLIQGPLEAASIVYWRNFEFHNTNLLIIPHIGKELIEARGEATNPYLSIYDCTKRS